MIRKAIFLILISATIFALLTACGSGATTTATQITTTTTPPTTTTPVTTTPQTITTPITTMPPTTTPASNTDADEKVASKMANCRHREEHVRPRPNLKLPS